MLHRCATMLPFKRAIIVAVVVLSCFLLLRGTYSRPQVRGPAQARDQSPRPTGSYSDARRLLDEPDPNAPPPAPRPEPTPTAKPLSESWHGDDGSRVALARKPEQIALEDVKSKTLREQLAYAFPYDLATKFPAYIWQTWKWAPSSGEFAEAFRPAEASWTELHPSFVHEVIVDNTAVHLIRHMYAGFPEVVEAYSALPVPVLKADFFRYLILLARGGIYSDIDTMALRSAVEWVPPEVPRTSFGLVIGIEADPDRDDWQDWYSRRIQFCQWTIQAKAGHPVLVDVVAAITEETLRRKTAGDLDVAHMHSVVEFTGPALWTDSIFRYFNNPDYFDMANSKTNITWRDFTGISKAKKVGDVVVLPITSFSPGVQQMGAGELDDPMAFVHHSFEGSWKPEEERHIGEQQ